MTLRIALSAECQFFSNHHNADYRYAGCHYDECRGALAKFQFSPIYTWLANIRNIMKGYLSFGSVLSSGTRTSTLVSYSCEYFKAIVMFKLITRKFWVINQWPIL
jgi:hypothetical protein